MKKKSRTLTIADELFTMVTAPNPYEINKTDISKRWNLNQAELKTVVDTVKDLCAMNGMVWSFDYEGRYAVYVTRKNGRQYPKRNFVLARENEFDKQFYLLKAQANHASEATKAIDPHALAFKVGGYISVDEYLRLAKLIEKLATKIEKIPGSITFDGPSSTGQ
jgi:hypothetical protein